MTNCVSSQRERQIERASYYLWQKYVKPHVKRSLVRTRDFRRMMERGPMPGHKNPIVRQIIRDGRGMDGFQSAMMTWGYLAAVCRHHEKVLRRRLRRRRITSCR